MISEKSILVLGNGPSLKVDYFSNFINIDSIGMNAAYRFWQKIDWYPTFYACLDGQVVVSHADAIAEMIKNDRFRHAFLHWRFLERYPDMAHDPRLTFLCQLTHNEDHVKHCSSLGLEHRPSRFFLSRSPRWFTTGSYSIRFAAHMGYRKVGIIGIDCRYQEILPEASSQGGHVLRIERHVEKNPNYFFNDYQQPGDFYHIPNPSVFDGNLHLHCIESLKYDNIDHEFGVDIRILTKESQIYDDRIFTFEALDNFIANV